MLPVDEPFARQEMFIDQSMVVMEMAVDDLRQELLQRLFVPTDGQSERPPAFVRVVRNFPRLGGDMGVACIVTNSKPRRFEVVDELQQTLRRLIQNDQVLDEIDLTHAWGDDGAYTRLDGEYPNNAAIFFELRWEDCYGLTHTSVQYMIDRDQTEITFPMEDELGYDADGWYFRDIVSTADGKLLGELK